MNYIDCFHYVDKSLGKMGFFQKNKVIEPRFEKHLSLYVNKAINWFIMSYTCTIKVVCRCQSIAFHRTKTGCWISYFLQIVPSLCK